MAFAMTETVAIEPTINMTLQVKPYPPKGSAPPVSTTTMKLQHLRIDPSRALEPARKKLTTVEAQRIMAVFEETIRRVEIVTVLPYIIKHIDRYRVSLGGELVELLKHHSVIITSYDEIRRELDKMLGKRASLEAEISRTPSDTNIVQDSTLTVGQGSGPCRRGQTSTSRPHSASMASKSAIEGNVGSQASITSNVGGKPVREISVASADREGPQSRMGSAASERTQGKSRMGSAASERSQEKSRMGSAASQRSQENARISSAQSKRSAGGQDEIGEEPGEALQEEDDGEEVSEEVVVSDEMMEAIMRNLSLVAQQMSHSTRNILRAFSLNPAVMTLITSDMTGRGRQCKEMLTYLQELREILMGKLLTTPEEERERMAYLTEISKRERHNAVIIEKLEAELKEKNDDKDEEIRKKNDVIKHLQSELHQIEKFSEEHIRRVRADAEKQEAADEKNSDSKRQKLQAEVGQLRSQLQNAIMEHREAEQELRKKKFKVETEVENWIQRYDQELGERQDEYEEIDEIYTEEKKQLHELEERFRTLEAEYTSIMEERRLAREKREKAERELAMMVKSATTIQAFWRSYKVRKALKARKKKKGKKDVGEDAKGKRKGKKK